MNASQISASRLMLHLRPRTVRLAGRTESLAGQPDPEGEAVKAREELAYARGRMDGERSVNEQLLRQRQEIRELQDRVLEPLRRAVGEVIRDSEHSLVALAIEVAERLVSEIPISHELVRAAINEALKQTRDTAECHIYLHPDDLELLEKWSTAGPAGETETMGASCPRSAGRGAGKEERERDGTALRFHASDEVERGGCVVKTRFGTVDGQRRTKSEQLRRTLLG